MTLYCPAHIEFLLWCHTRCEGHPNRDLALYRDLAADLSREGVIKDEGDGRYSTTEKGKAWVQMLCDLPSPRLAWADAHGNIISPQ